MRRANEQVDFPLVAALSAFLSKCGECYDFATAIVADSELNLFEHVPAAGGGPRGPWVWTGGDGESDEE